MSMATVILPLLFGQEYYVKEMTPWGNDPLKTFLVTLFSLLFSALIAV